ncbi:3660_t:CDS:2, partial [Diversispora eburnea]
VVTEVESDDIEEEENENVIDEQFTDEKIVDLVCSSRETEENDIENKDESSELLPVSIKEATESLDILVRFFLNQEGNYSKEISLMKIQHVLRILKKKVYEWDKM